MCKAKIADFSTCSNVSIDNSKSGSDLFDEKICPKNYEKIQWLITSENIIKYNNDIFLGQRVTL